MKLINIAKRILREEDTSADAEFEDYTNRLMDEVIDKVKELEELVGGDTDYILDMLKKRMQGRDFTFNDEELPF